MIFSRLFKFTFWYSKGPHVTVYNRLAINVALYRSVCVGGGEEGGGAVGKWQHWVVYSPAPMVWQEEMYVSPPDQIYISIRPKTLCSRKFQ